MSIYRLALPLLACVVWVGCVNVEETITLRHDGSGTAHVRVAFPQPAMQWLPGKPSEDWVRPNLPDGVRLNSFINKQGKTKLTDPMGKEHVLTSEIYEVDIAFDDVEALNAIRVHPDKRNALAAIAGGTPGKDGAMMARRDNPAPSSGPFQKVTLVKDGDVLHFRRIVQAARSKEEIAADKLNTPGSDVRPQTFGLGKSALKISINAPGEVIEHNADKVSGRTLTWEFQLQELQDRQDRDWIVEFRCRRGEEK